VVAGLVLAAVLGKLLMSGLYGVAPLDPPTFIIAPIFLASVALLASYIPARRATSVDPMQTLRQE
jgi:putative ABC transport system permease protein